ncbi:MAG: hypothetical protein KJZ68_07265, partial [Phycisphaerales bacterium]|nr:hypothetical protein [Phycisphaerales bacterium]
ITSGCWSPTLEKSIAMAYVDAALSAEGATFTIDTEKLNAPATVCGLPFYKAAG